MTGARPIDSSSIISSLGVDRNAMPKASCCCCPPDRLAAGSACRWSSTGNTSRTRSMPPRRALASWRCSQLATSRFSLTDSDGNVPTPPGTWRTPRPAISAGGVAVMSTPSKMIAPRSASTIPEIVLRSVDLPAPLVPSRAMISPSSTSRLTSKSTCTPP